MVFRVSPEPFPRFGADSVSGRLRPASLFSVEYSEKISLQNSSPLGIWASFLVQASISESDASDRRGGSTRTRDQNQIDEKMT